MTYTKESVQHHADHFGPSRPAVNVKVYGSIYDVKLPIHMGSSHPAGHPELMEDHYTEAGFTREWLEAHAEELQWTWEAAIEAGWEALQQAAEEAFGTHVTVYAEGRSGGWAVVDGLKDFDSWDAIDLGKWRRFEREAKAIAADVPYQMVMMAYFNLYELELDIR